MPTWLYHMSPGTLAAILVGAFVGVALVGLALARRFLLPRLKFDESVNDAISGAVQAIGVFYGVTVGLIAIGVWDSYANARDIASREAASIATLHAAASELPDRKRNELQSELCQYLKTLIEETWPEQIKGGRLGRGNWRGIVEMRQTLADFEPTTEGERIRYAETLNVFHELVEVRRRRIDATTTGLSPIMWWVIVGGAVISVGVAYLFDLKDAKIHAGVIALMSAFLGIIFFMIVINDKPFLGAAAIQPDSYELVRSQLFHRDPNCSMK